MRSWIYLFSCNLMWALQFTCVKLVQKQVGTLFTIWGPMTLATIMLIPHIRLEKKCGQGRNYRKKSDVFLFVLLAILGVFPGQVLITWGTRMSLASDAALIMLTLPLSTALLAVIFLHERMTAVRWVSFVLAVIGVVMCSNLDFRSLNLGSGYLYGNLLIFVGTLGSAFYNSYGKKVLERYSPMEMLFLTYVAMFVIMTPLLLSQEWKIFGQITSFTARTWAGLILLTVFHNYLSMVLFLKALKQLDAIQAALSNYLITFFGIPIAAVWLGEKLSFLAIVGGLLVLGSTLLITLRDSKPATENGFGPPESS
jgi:drug/metabolite transporter (DMT)-like permease